MTADATSLQDQPTSATAPVLRALTPVTRAALIVEILAAYLPALIRLRGNDLPAMVKAARNVRVARTGLGKAIERDLTWRTSWAVRRTLAVLPTDSRCLIRSLVLTRLLARRGIETKLVIGVKPGETFEAHAWVELAGEAVLPVHRFERLLEL